MTNWELVGSCDVDAGLIWLGDPCYIMETNYPWEKFCDDLTRGGFYEKMTQVFSHATKHPGQGIVVSSGYGDGTYDVFVKRDSEGRIAEAKIVFIS